MQQPRTIDASTAHQKSPRVLAQVKPPAVAARNPHLDQQDTERDPNYDYDHSTAHGTQRSGSDLWRIRTMSHSHALEALDASQRQRLADIMKAPKVNTQIFEEVEPLEQVVTMITSAGDVVAPVAHSPVIHRRRRRGSHDEKASKPRQFLIDVEETQRAILAQEDLDGDCQITVTDQGPKVFLLGTLDSRGTKKFELRGTYALANLLQELAVATDHGRKRIILDEDRLTENPVDRLSRMIKHHFWDGLTRRIDADGLELICLDPKDRTANHRSRIYVPHGDPEALEYYQKTALKKTHLNLDVIKLPEDITPEYVKSINEMPGLLALALYKNTDEAGKTTMRGAPFVVPGGRFNEQYGWDSYFESLGLLIDGRVSLSRSMVDNFVYEIKHYGKILNANRSYYLTRSQPPFLTQMTLHIYAKLATEKEAENKEWLATCFRAAIQEYDKVWMSEPRYVPSVGLSRFHPEGLGMPPETEASHFDAVLRPYAKKHSMDIPTFSEKYKDGSVKEPALDQYFTHDRAVRESGQDTTYRLEGICAHVCPVDLNCMLYKYEVDIGTTIQQHFGDSFKSYDESVQDSAMWFDRADKRKKLINEYCWNEQAGLFFDYHITVGKQNPYEGVITYFTMWAGIASKIQAERMMKDGLPKFEVLGGLVTGTEQSRGHISLMRPNRQWDYPFGWAPLQIIAWKGMSAYGYDKIAQRLSYRWLFTITKAFVDFNGVVPEKFDVVSLNHKVKVEYGNVGIDFKFIPREGFGWMNSSYKVGLTFITSHMRRALGTLVPPDKLFPGVLMNQDHPTESRMSV